MGLQFNNPIVQGEDLAISGIRSPDYIPAQAGWRIGQDGSVQFSNAQFIGDVGTTGQLSADSFQVGPTGLFDAKGEDLIADFVERDRWFPDPDGPHPNGPVGPKGIVGYYSGSPSGTFSGTETGVIACRFVVETNRTYAIFANIRITKTVGTDAWYVRFRMTTNNTIPTVTSTLLKAILLTNYGDVTRNIGGFPAVVNPGVIAGSPAIGYIAMTLSRDSGTGTATVLANAENFCDIAIVDIGPQPGTTEATADSRGGIDVYSTPGSTYSAPTAPPTPVQTYTKTYQPQWSRTYDGDNTTTWDDSAHCYQGYYSSDRGNTRSLVGYNYTQIQSDLSGATISSVKLTFKVAHAYLNAGMTVVIGGHNYTAKPSTWNGANVTENQYTSGSKVAGSTYTVTLPAAFGTNLKSGTWKGIAFGPGPSTSNTYYGYLYGATETGKPYLTITYKK